MSDLIDRQAAIMDAESWVAVDEYEKHLQKNVVKWLKEFPPAEQKIKTLPSAEPEIIRCKDCRYYRRMIDQDDLCKYRQIQVFDDDFCSRAERRTDG